MFSIQECVDKTAEQTRKIEEYMDTNGYFDPYECNIFLGLKRSVQRELAETFRRTTIKEWVTSTGLATGTLGAGGVNYLVPTYVSTRLHMAMSGRDVAPAVSAEVFEDQAGETVYVNSLARMLAGITEGPSSTGGSTFNAATVSMERVVAPMIITNEMIEDSQYNLVEFGIRGAGVAMAEQTTDKLCAILKRTTGTTGWGTKTTEAAGADTTTPANVAACAQEVAAGDPAGGIGMYYPNLLVCTPEVWNDALTTTAGHPTVHPPLNPMFDAWYSCLNVKFVNSDQMGTVSGNKLTNAVTIVMEKERGIVTCRKNWLRIENYSNPVKDLAGAVVSGKQGIGELVDAAIGVLTET